MVVCGGATVVVWWWSCGGMVVERAYCLVVATRPENEGQIPHSLNGKIAPRCFAATIRSQHRNDDGARDGARAAVSASERTVTRRDPRGAVLHLRAARRGGAVAGALLQRLVRVGKKPLESHTHTSFRTTTADAAVERSSTQTHTYILPGDGRSSPSRRASSTATSRSAPPRR